ncbi:hypothetical protein [Anaerobiospirillum succiniciproducens]|uniref:hypothetical protein n=1 Tax=Anaerobiospirillum succiniciproducens TaxID=13335 RepID=UPI0004208B4C|nr:hypothetical protein [Anaerobiospirillum succiniciproducens]
MAFSDYKDLLPTTRVVSMSDLGKVSSRPKSTQNTVPNMSMNQRIDEYMATSKHPKGSSTFASSTTSEPSKLAANVPVSTNVTVSTTPPVLASATVSSAVASSTTSKVKSSASKTTHTAKRGSSNAASTKATTLASPVTPCALAPDVAAPSSPLPYASDNYASRSFAMDKDSYQGAKSHDAYTQVWQEYDAVLGAYDEAHLERVDTTAPHAQSVDTSVPHTQSVDTSVPHTQSVDASASYPKSMVMPPQDEKVATGSEDGAASNDLSSSSDLSASSEVNASGAGDERAPWDDATGHGDSVCVATVQHEQEIDDSVFVAQDSFDGVVVSEASAIGTHAPSANAASSQSLSDNAQNSGSALSSSSAQDGAASEDEELDFDGILEAYEALQSESDNDEHYASLKGKDLSSGKGMPLLETQGGYGRALRATDSTAGFSDEVAPWEQGIPEELRKFIKNRNEEDDDGPKYTELENKRAQEALIEHERISAEGHKRLSVLENTAQWHVDPKERRESTGIKYTRSSYMKPRGAEEKEYYSGERRDFGAALQEILRATRVHVSRIEDRNYQKLCFMETQDGDRFKLSVFYNKRDLVSFVQTSSELEDAKEVFYLLKNLVGSSIHNIQLKSDEQVEAYIEQTERDSNRLLKRNKNLTLVDEDTALKAVKNNQLSAQGSVEAGMGTVVPFAKRLNNILTPLGFKVGAIEDKNYLKQVELVSPQGNQLKLSVYYKGNDKISSFKFNKMPPEDMEILKLCLQSFEEQLLNTPLDLFKAKSMKRTLHSRN